MSLYTQIIGPAHAPSIVFLHGLGVSSWMWQEQVEVLSETYRCLLIDLPGQGESYQTEWHSLADTAQQVAGIIREQVPSGSAHVVGLSLGGYTALTLWQNHPEVIESLVVSGVITRPLRNQWFFNLFVALMPALLKSDLVMRLNERLMNLPPEAVVLMRKDTARMSARTFQVVNREVMNFHLPEDLAQRSQPALIVAGDKEVKAVLEGLREFRASLPQTTVRIAPNAHHAWVGEHPQLFADMLRAWFQHDPLPSALQVI
jgi:pimeloyl-ACP methyl ester carboxylesterase